MPRITYHDRFAALLAKDYLTSRDRTFASSLYSHYRRKGSLTTGRRRCFLQLEERYATRPTPIAGADELDVIIGRVEQIAGEGSWDFGFITSVQSQLRAGRPLSDRQTEILAGIEEKYGDDQMAEREAWIAAWDAEKAEHYRIVMTYYGRGGYYGRQVQAFRANPEIVPTMKQYNAITNNKFAKKVLAGWFSAPKFPVGSMVALGAGARWELRQKCKAGMAIVVSVNAEVPNSAARGNKIYKLLPIGGVETLLCEERHLKRARAPKRKK